MLSGPPRLLSLIAVVCLFVLGWWYFLLAHNTSALPLGSSRTAPAYKNDELDFSFPLRFKEGAAKQPGQNYTVKMVLPKMQKEDISYLHKELPDVSLVIYEVDNPNAKFKIPKNKGREAMVYLTYLIDHYDDLPDTVLFMHAHRHAWHNNMLMGLDTVQMVKRLNHDRVARNGYMNVRCHHDPGCPDWIHMDRPGGDFDFVRKPEEIHIRRHIWEQLHPGAPIPPSLSGICCAQFAVSRDRIRQVPLARFKHYRKWLLETNMDDQFSGRVFEYIWHYIFTGHEVYCPAMNTCYCDGYGFCFGGRQKFDDYFKKQDARNKLNEELSEFTKKEDKAKEENKTITWNEKEQARIDELRREIGKMDTEMDATRNEATKRGEDPKLRAEETENWDSTHIFDYAQDGPKGPKNN